MQINFGLIKKIGSLAAVFDGSKRIKRVCYPGVTRFDTEERSKTINEGAAYRRCGRSCCDLKREVVLDGVLRRPVLGFIKILKKLYKLKQQFFEDGLID